MRSHRHASNVVVQARERAGARAAAPSLRAGARCGRGPAASTWHHSLLVPYRRRTRAQVCVRGSASAVLREAGGGESQHLGSSYVLLKHFTLVFTFLKKELF